MEDSSGPTSMKVGKGGSSWMQSDIDREKGYTEKSREMGKVFDVCIPKFLDPGREVGVVL